VCLTGVASLSSRRFAQGLRQAIKKDTEERVGGLEQKIQGLDQQMREQTAAINRLIALSSSPPNSAPTVMVPEDSAPTVMVP